VSTPRDQQIEAQSPDDAFYDWLTASGYDAVPLPPEQLSKLRQQFENENK
jgi:hypothetical protein